MLQLINIERKAYIFSMSALCSIFFIGCSDTGSKIREIQKRYEQVQAANDALKEANARLTKANEDAHQKIRELEESVSRVRESNKKERLAWKRLYNE